jgi:hypothetical protein
MPPTEAVTHDAEQLIQGAAKCDSLTCLADARALLDSIQRETRLADVRRRELAGDVHRADLASPDEARVHDEALADVDRRIRRLGAAEARVSDRLRELEVEERAAQLRALEAQADAIVTRYRAANAKRRDLYETVARLDDEMRALLEEIDPIRGKLAQFGEASTIASIDERLHSRGA